MAKIPRNKRRRSSSPPPPLIKRPKRTAAVDGADELARLARSDAKPDKQASPSSSSSTSSSSKAARVTEEEDEDAMMLPHAATSAKAGKKRATKKRVTKGSKASKKTASPSSKASKASTSLPVSKPSNGKGIPTTATKGLGRQAKKTKPSKVAPSDSTLQASLSSTSQSNEVPAAGSASSDGDDADEDNVAEEITEDAAPESLAKHLYKCLGRLVGNVENLISTIASFAQPTPAILRSIFRKELSDGEDDEEEDDEDEAPATAAPRKGLERTDEQGVKWWKSKGSNFERNEANERRYSPCPKPPSQPAPTGQSWWIGVKQMAAAWLARKLDLGIKIQSWMEQDSFSFRKLSDDSRLTFEPMFAELSEVFKDADNFTAQWCLDRESQSIEGYNEASLKNGASSFDDMASIIYFKVGLRDGLVPFAYVGQSNCGDIRTIEHEGKTVKWQIAGPEQAPWLYQQLAQCSKVITWKIITVDKARKLSTAERARSLNIAELLCCWGLGTYQFSQKLLDARAQRGLPHLPKQMGLNSDPCTKKPHHDSGDDEKLGIQDKTYCYLAAKQRRTFIELVRARFFVDAGHADAQRLVEAQKAHEGSERAKDIRWQQLMSSGDMKVLLDLTATARPRIGGAVISQDEWIRIKRLFRGAKRGLVKVRTRCGTPSNATDYALSCPEELIPLARGLIMEVDRADRNNDSWPIALQNNMLPLSQDHLQVIERMVNGRPEQERLERRQKAADKRLEINGRKCDDFDSMTPLERALNLGNARLRSMQRVCGPTSKPDKRGLNREGFTVWKESNAQRASTTYGFGTLRKSASGKRRIMPQTSVRMIDTGGDGIFEQSVHFGRAQGRPEEANLGLLFLTFEGEWKPAIQLAKMATFGIDVESQLTTARPARLILNAGRMMKGLERREELEFPIGVEISTNLALSGPGAAPAYQTQLALNEGVRLEVSKAALRGTFDEIPRKGSKVDIATSICDPQATIANIRVWLRRSAEGDQAPGNWYEMPISDVVKARLWNFYIPHRDAFKQKGRPFPSAMPNLN